MNNWIEHLRDRDYDKIQALIEVGEDVNASNEVGESVLMYALRHRCDFSVLMKLVKSGADIFAVDNEGVSVFDMAITYNNLDMVKYIIEKGVDVNTTKRKSGFTPLMCASSYGRYDVAKLLLKEGADKQKIDSSGLSAHDYSRKMNKKSILKLLEEH